MLLFLLLKFVWGCYLFSKYFGFSHPNFLSVTCRICITVCVMFFSETGLHKIFCPVCPRNLIIYPNRKLKFFGFFSLHCEKTCNMFISKFWQRYWTLTNHENNTRKNLFFRKLILVKAFLLKGEARFENHFSKIGLFSFVFTYKTFLPKQFVILDFSYFAIAC